MCGWSAGPGGSETQVRGWVDGVGNEVVLFVCVLSVVVILLVGYLFSDGRRLFLSTCICTIFIHCIGEMSTQNKLLA